MSDVNFVVAVNNFGDTRSGGLAGPMGLFVIVLMSIATVLLIRNMNKRLRRLPDSFPDPAAVAREAEIARLNADLQRSGGAGTADGSVENASTGLDRPAEAEVTRVENADPKRADDSRGEPA